MDDPNKSLADLWDTLRKLGIEPPKPRRVLSKEEVNARNKESARLSLGQPITIKEGKGKFFRGTIAGCQPMEGYFHVIVRGPTGTIRGFNVKRIPVGRR